MGSLAAYGSDLLIRFVSVRLIATIACVLRRPQPNEKLTDDEKRAKDARIERCE